jgi:hypothetical protein
MLRNESAIDGYAIAASDGKIGTVSDFLFDDASWLVRWLVVDTGNWLSGASIRARVTARRRSYRSCRFRRSAS